MKIKLIKNGMIVFPEKSAPLQGDIFLEGEKIKRIELKGDKGKKGKKKKDEDDDLDD